MTLRSLLFCPVLFVSTTLLAQSKFIRAQRMGDPTDTIKSVSCLAKLELGIWLPDQYQTQIDNFLKDVDVPEKQKINPFLEWELDIEATFTHAASGTVKKAEAFYFRDFERDEAGNSWKDLNTRIPMRIRFAPTLPGDWICTVTIKIDGNEIGQQCSYSFKAENNSLPGYVAVHPNKRNFVRDGQFIYPVGVNFPSPTRTVYMYHTSPQGGASYQPDETHKVTKLNDWKTYLDDVKSFGKSGGKYIRILQSGWGSLIEFEKKGNYYDRLNYAWEQDKLIDLCESTGMLVQFNLMQQEPFMKYGNYDMFDWDWSHYNADGSWFAGDIYPAYCYAEGQDKSPHDMFLNEEDLKYHEQRNRYYISRYGYSTSIYLFELLSEPWHLDQMGVKKEAFLDRTPEGELIRKAVQNYHERMAGYIKHTMGHTQHLIGIDMVMPNYFEADPVFDQSIMSPDIDVVGLNPYSLVPEKLVISKTGDPLEVTTEENSFYHLVSWLQSYAMKPVIISEGGAGDGADECSSYAQQSLDMASFGFTGIAGFSSWAGWANGQEMTWPQIIAMCEFINQLGVPVLNNGNSDWRQGRQVERNGGKGKKIKEMQYYLSEANASAIGYVKNRSFNAFTMKTKDYCGNEAFNDAAPLNVATDVSFDDGKPLVVRGLKSGKHTISWYDFKTGQLISSEEVKVRGKKLKLKHPDLTVTKDKPQVPAALFVIEPTKKASN